MHEYVVRQLAPMTGIEIEEVSIQAKLSKWTTQKIRIGQIKNPGVDKVQALYDVLKLRESKKRRAA